MSEIIYFVYRLTFANGKFYIGMSKTCEKKGYLRRFHEHASSATSGRSTPVYCAWRKHGEPKFEILSRHKDRKSCAEAEISAIAEHGSIQEGNGYNIMGGGEGQQAGQNPRLWAILNEKVWSNPEVRRKISEKLKGRKPSEATMAAYAEFCKTPAKAEAARKAWRCPEYRAMKSETTRRQMANGGAKLLSEKLKGRADPRSEEGKESHREKIKEWVNSAAGRAVCRKGYEVMASNPKNVATIRAALDKWRASEKNAENCRRMAKIAAANRSKPIKNLETCEVFGSQKEMAIAYGLSDAAIAKRRKRGLYEYIIPA